MNTTEISIGILIGRVIVHKQTNSWHTDIEYIMEKTTILVCKILFEICARPVVWILLPLMKAP